MGPALRLDRKVFSQGGCRRKSFTFCTSNLQIGTSSMVSPPWTNSSVFLLQPQRMYICEKRRLVSWSKKCHLDKALLPRNWWICALSSSNCRMIALSCSFSTAWKKHVMQVQRMFHAYEGCPQICGSCPVSRLSVGTIFVQEPWTCSRYSMAYSVWPSNCDLRLRSFFRWQWNRRPKQGWLKSRTEQSDWIANDLSARHLFFLCPLLGCLHLKFLWDFCWNAWFWMFENIPRTVNLQQNVLNFHSAACLAERDRHVLVNVSDSTLMLCGYHALFSSPQFLLQDLVTALRTKDQELAHRCCLSGIVRRLKGSDRQQNAPCETALFLVEHHHCQEAVWHPDDLEVLNRGNLLFLCCSISWNLIRELWLENVRFRAEATGWRRSTWLSFFLLLWSASQEVSQQKNYPFCMQSIQTLFCLHKFSILPKSSQHAPRAILTQVNGEGCKCGMNALPVWATSLYIVRWAKWSRKDKSGGSTILIRSNTPRMVHLNPI